VNNQVASQITLFHFACVLRRYVLLKNEVKKVGVEYNTDCNVVEINLPKKYNFKKNLAISTSKGSSNLFWMYVVLFLFLVCTKHVRDSMQNQLKQDVV